MRSTNTLIVGGGQAGLAMSRCLTDRGVDHVVIERGRVGERWRAERRESLRLLTPNWQSRLPGWSYAGSDPDGYMTMPEVVTYLEDYARFIDAPLVEATPVEAVEIDGHAYRVTTPRGAWRAEHVVVASGHCDLPYVPAMARALPRDILQLTPNSYRGAERLPRGGVLVVGASASGVQLAEEIGRSGRPVTLAVGRHTRLPRVYRGRDVMYWLDVMGLLDEAAADVHHLEAARRGPSLQLVGRPDRSSIDLATLRACGVKPAGRLVALTSRSALFSGDLEDSVRDAELRLQRTLARIDAFIAHERLSAPQPESIAPVGPCGAGPSELDLRAAGIASVVWATGYRRRYPWLRVPVLDARGEIRHDGGVTPAPGLYVLGLPLLRRRNSNYIDGVGRDAIALGDHLVARATARRTAVA